MCALPCQDRPCAAHVMANIALVILCLALAGTATCNAAASVSRLVMKPLDLRAARGQADGLPRDVHGAPEQFSGYFQVRRGSACTAICLLPPDRSLLLQRAEACMPVVLPASCSSAPPHEAYTDSLLASCAPAAVLVCCRCGRSEARCAPADQPDVRCRDVPDVLRGAVCQPLRAAPGPVDDGRPGMLQRAGHLLRHAPLPASPPPARLLRALTRARPRAENGPFKITEDLELRESEYGWDQAANIVFVDQPINTGFSYSADPRDRVYDETVVAADMLDFLHAFLERFPRYKGRAFFITGEVRARGEEAGRRPSAACGGVRTPALPAASRRLPPPGRRARPTCGRRAGRTRPAGKCAARMGMRGPDHGARRRRATGVTTCPRSAPPSWPTTAAAAPTRPSTWSASRSATGSPTRPSSTACTPTSARPRASSARPCGSPSTRRACCRPPSRQRRLHGCGGR